MALPALVNAIVLILILAGVGFGVLEPWLAITSIFNVLALGACAYVYGKRGW